MIGPLLAGFALAALAAWVIRPLLEPYRRTGEATDARLDALTEAKHAVYHSILDLELDRRLGKVSDEDHAFLRRQHEVDALRILREVDEAATRDSLEDVLEREIAAARERRRLGSR